MVRSLRQIARGTQWWVALRRAQREGWRLSFLKLWIWPQILRSQPVHTSVGSLEGGQCEVHLLCSARDYLSAIWAIKSFYMQAGQPALPLTIHFDSIIPQKIDRRLRKQFPDARIVGRDEADSIVEPFLEERKLFRLLAARKSGAFILKLTDFTLISRSSNIISFDSDVLFFDKPEQILQAATSDFAGALVQVDLGSVYNIDGDHAKALGWELPERVNTGIMAFERHIVDLEACDQLLADAELARNTGWIEQTLYALLFGRSGRLRFLPAAYTIPVPGDVWQDSGIVARHYAGASRPLLTLQGMRWLLRQKQARG